MGISNNDQSCDVGCGWPLKGTKSQPWGMGPSASQDSVSASWEQGLLEDDSSLASTRSYMVEVWWQSLLHSSLCEVQFLPMLPFPLESTHEQDGWCFSRVRQQCLEGSPGFSQLDLKVRGKISLFFPFVGETGPGSGQRAKRQLLQRNPCSWPSQLQLCCRLKMGAR